MSNAGDELTFLKRTHQLLEWAHGGEDPWETFGSTLQIVATLKALAEQEVTWILWRLKFLTSQRS